MAVFSPPPQKGYTGYPAWYYGPNGQAQLFKTAKDVPAGWTDHPAKVDTAPLKSAAPATPAAPPVKKAPSLTREQVIAALQEAGVAYKSTDSLAALYKQLEAVAAAGE